MNIDFSLNSPESVRDVIGFLHHSISQHTKEIAVINTTLADLNKNKFNFEFKENFEDYADETNRKIERLTRSMKLLTKQIFNSEISLGKMNEQNNQENNKYDEEIKNINKNIDEILKKQSEILQRLDNLEQQQKNYNSQPVRKQVRFSTAKNIMIYDSKPINEEFKDIQNPQNISQVLDYVKKQISEVNNLRQIQDENNKRFGQFIQVAQDSLNHLNDEILASNHHTENELHRIRQELDLYAKQEDLNMIIRSTPVKPGNSRYSQTKRVGTSSLATRSIRSVDQGEYSVPSVNVTMISGESLKRPATTQGVRYSSSSTAHIKFRK